MSIYWSCRMSHCDFRPNGYAEEFVESQSDRDEHLQRPAQCCRQPFCCPSPRCCEQYAHVRGHHGVIVLAFSFRVLCPVLVGVRQVQEAVRTTVMGLLGSLPRHAFETTAIATGDALANLMFQLQMTGYMFKNAEYRLSLRSSMRASAALPPGKRLCLAF